MAGFGSGATPSELNNKRLANSAERLNADGLPEAQHGSEYQEL